MIGIFWIAMSVSDFEGVHLTPRGDAAWSPRLMDQGGETISHLAWRWGSFKQGMQGQGRANWCWLRSAKMVGMVGLGKKKSTDIIVIGHQ